MKHPNALAAAMADQTPWTPKPHAPRPIAPRVKLKMLEKLRRRGLNVYRHSSDRAMVAHMQDSRRQLYPCKVCESAGMVEVSRDHGGPGAGHWTSEKMIECPEYHGEGEV